MLITWQIQNDISSLTELMCAKHLSQVFCFEHNVQLVFFPVESDEYLVLPFLISMSQRNTVKYQLVAVINRLPFSLCHNSMPPWL
jgi:hypothetical protein